METPREFADVLDRQMCMEANILPRLLLPAGMARGRGSHPGVALFIIVGPRYWNIRSGN